MGVQFPAEIIGADRTIEGNRLHVRWECADGSWLETVTEFPAGTVLDEYAQGFDPRVRGTLISAQSNCGIEIDPATGDIRLVPGLVPQRN